MKVGNRDITITHPDKLMYPADGITKQQVVEYYLRVAPVMLPLIKDRPIVMQRYPDGIDGESFFQKEASDYFPKWIKTIAVDLIKGGQQHLVVVDSAATLAYLANQAALTLHVWLSTVHHLNQPDRMIFDLDPGDNDFSKARAAAKIVKAILEERSYKPLLMSTGSRGLHVIVPLDPNRPFEQVHEESQNIAAQAVSLNSDLLTTEARKADRQQKIYVDVGRNSYGQTGVAPYSLRAKPGAPVAAPLAWNELASLRSAGRYTLKNIARRLAKRPNPWDKSR